MTRKQIESPVVQICFCILAACHSLYFLCTKCKEHIMWSTVWRLTSPKVQMWIIMLTKEAMWVQRNTEARLQSHCCRGKAISFNYIFWVCICSLSYPARKGHVPYCHLWPLRLHIFPHYLIKDAIFGKTLLNKKCVLIFSTTLIWNISHCKNNSARHCHKWENIFT